MPSHTHTLFDPVPLNYELAAVPSLNAMGAGKLVLATCTQQTPPTVTLKVTLTGNQAPLQDVCFREATLVWIGRSGAFDLTLVIPASAPWPPGIYDVHYLYEGDATDHSFTLQVPDSPFRPDHRSDSSRQGCVTLNPHQETFVIQLPPDLLFYGAPMLVLQDSQGRPIPDRVISVVNPDASRMECRISPPFYGPAFVYWTSLVGVRWGTSP